METVILDIDTNFENAEMVNNKTKKQDILNSIGNYVDSLNKAVSILTLLKDNICDDEKKHITILLNTDNKLCVRATSEVAERFVCFGIANYDEYDCNSESESDSESENDDENHNDSGSESDTESEDTSNHNIDDDICDLVDDIEIEMDK